VDERVGVAAGRCGVVAPLVGGDEQNARPGGRGFVLDPAAEVRAALVERGRIEENDVRALRAQERERVGSGCRIHDPEAGVRQDASAVLSILGPAVDVEDRS
jgi:hypothetical protein